MNWIDTETKAILQRAYDPPLSPPKVADFGLVLGFKGKDQGRLIRAVCRINDCKRAEAIALVSRPSPLTINVDLTEEEATLGQFELVCCEAISAVVRSEVAMEAGHEYLVELFQRISRSPEFQSTIVRIDDVPRTEAGQRFVDQFLGMDLTKLSELGLPRRFRMPVKKARIMKHWASKVGAKVHENGAEPSAPPGSGS